MPKPDTTAQKDVNADETTQHSPTPDPNTVAEVNTPDVLKENEKLKAEVISIKRKANQLLHAIREAKAFGFWNLSWDVQASEDGLELILPPEVKMLISKKTVGSKKVSTISHFNAPKSMSVQDIARMTKTILMVNANRVEKSKSLPAEQKLAPYGIFIDTFGEKKQAVNRLVYADTNEEQRSLWDSFDPEEDPFAEEDLL